MFISIFDLFKIGIGPSSSHTMGPMVAAARFFSAIEEFGGIEAGRISVVFYGSLAFTGKGHASDQAVVLGLMGEMPHMLNPDAVAGLLLRQREDRVIHLSSDISFRFDPDVDLIFDYGPALKAHPNGMVFTLYDEVGGAVFSKTYYSIGGGFVLSEGEISVRNEVGNQGDEDVPYPYNNAVQLLAVGEESGLSIAQIKAENEKSLCSKEQLYNGINDIWQAMDGCITRGLSKDGVLPGALNIPRRASEIKRQLDNEKGSNAQSAHVCNEWLSLYAMAVNEENASGGRVVTAPTNGAAGVIPAVLRYYLDFIPDADEAHIPEFLLTAAAIGGIIKNNASISGAEVGCQGEVGSASAMAAAGLCAVMGGSNEQIENAAEIALEHHLGMTCDPVGGLVQVPCIERNGLGAVKAVTASALALRGNGVHFVPLDSCIETMRQTGEDMRARYKETSRGGLAVNVIEC
ncbi:MAG: L-serine ammonia-lyase [Alphaproteobacteria bacterium]